MIQGWWIGRKGWGGGDGEGQREGGLAEWDEETGRGAMGRDRGRRAGKGQECGGGGREGG